jgi:YtfJ family uncharacterized protein
LTPGPPSSILIFQTVELRIVHPNVWRLKIMYLTKMYLLMIVSAVCLTTTQPAWAGLKIGQVPKQVDLKGDLGGRLDGSPWNSNELKGKINVIFYVDPDEKDLNNEASDALQKEKFPKDKFQSYGIINMDATWLPNILISSALEEKQKKYPTTIYVRDYDKILVKAWGIADDNSDVLAFDKQGKLIFQKYGKLTDSDIQKLVEVIRAHLDK